MSETRAVSLDALVPKGFSGVVRLTVEDGALVKQANVSADRMHQANRAGGRALAEVLAELIGAAVTPRMDERVVIERISKDANGCKVTVE